MDRVIRAIEDGALALPDGPILVIGAGADADLAALGEDRLTFVQPLRAAHDRLAAQGLSVMPSIPEGAAPFAAALVSVPRARDAARLAVAQAVGLVAPGAPVLVDGQRTDGIDPLYRAVRGRAEVGGTATRGHGRLFWFAADAGAFADWAALAAPRDVGGGMTAPPGAFSADGPDPGSAALTAALPPRLSGRWADFGAGWGYLSAALLGREGIAEVHLVEADHAALAAARTNVADPRAVFHWANVTAWTAPDRPGRLDGIVMNPPFHQGRRAEPELGRAFIAAAATSLAPHGALWMVANRHLPYEAALAGHFSRVEEVPGTPAFKIIHATRPQHAAGAGRSKGRRSAATRQGRPV